MGHRASCRNRERALAEVVAMVTGGTPQTQWHKGESAGLTGCSYSGDRSSGEPRRVGVPEIRLVVPTTVGRASDT